MGPGRRASLSVRGGTAKAEGARAAAPRPLVYSAQDVARFFVAVAPEGQRGAHDAHETMSSFWATPAEVLRRWSAGGVQLAPPTHATLTLLATCSKTDSVLALASSSCLDPICPRAIVQKGAGELDTVALATSACSG